jgi:hypothetical protein
MTFHSKHPHMNNLSPEEIIKAAIGIQTQIDILQAALKICQDNEEIRIWMVKELEAMIK